MAVIGHSGNSIAADPHSRTSNPIARSPLLPKEQISLITVLVEISQRRMVSPTMASPPLSTTTVPSPPKTGNLKSNRFGRPCDACKRRKQRCVFRDGQEDLCVMCEFQNVPCTFTDTGIVPSTTRKRSGPSNDTSVRKRRQKSNK